MIQRKVDLSEQSLLYTETWCKAMTHLEGMTRRRRKVVLAELLTSLRAEDVGGVAAFTAGVLMPDHQRSALGITSSIMRKAFAEVTGKTEEDIRALVAQAGGYPNLASEIIPENPSPMPITLPNVRAWLLELLGYAREPLEMTVFLLQTLGPLMSKYLLRTLTGELPIGIDTYGVLEATAVAAGMEPEVVWQCFELTNSLEDAAQRAFRGRRALAQVHCRTGRPYRLMPATPLASVAEAFDRFEGPVTIEHEIPGIRFEIHRRHASIQLYTRQLKDVTRAFPELASALEGSLMGTDDLILEGQAYLPGVSAEESERILDERLTQLPTRRGEVLKPSTLLTMSVIDITRQGREDMMQRPLSARKIRLGQLFRVGDRISVPEALTTSSIQEAEAFAEEARRSGLAGVMLKAADGRYEAGKEGIWYRFSFRPEYIELTAIDAAVNKAGEINKLNLACRFEGGLAAVGEVSGTGADPELWQQLQKRARDYFLIQKGDRYELMPGLIVAVSPRAIKAAPRRRAGYSLTGMTIQRIREDKGAFESNGPERLAHIGTLMAGTKHSS